MGQDRSSSKHTNYKMEIFQETAVNSNKDGGDCCGYLIMNQQ